MVTSITTTVHHEGKVIRVNAHHYTQIEYDLLKGEYGIYTWYDRKESKEDDAFQARGFVRDKPETEGADIHLVSLDLDVVGHELLHLFGKHHPTGAGDGTLRARLKHGLEAVFHAIFVVKFSVQSFSGLFRWYDPDNIRPQAAYIIAQLKEAGAQ